MSSHLQPMSKCANIYASNQSEQVPKSNRCCIWLILAILWFFYIQIPLRRIDVSLFCAITSLQNEALRLLRCARKLRFRDSEESIEAYGLRDLVHVLIEEIGE